MHVQFWIMSSTYQVSNHRKIHFLVFKFNLIQLILKTKSNNFESILSRTCIRLNAAVSIDIIFTIYCEFGQVYNAIEV